jgi:hypothetical protein
MQRNLAFLAYWCGFLFFNYSRVKIGLANGLGLRVFKVYHHPPFRKSEACALIGVGKLSDSPPP